MGFKIPDIVGEYEIYFKDKKHNIKILSFFDDDFNADRYSYEIRYDGGMSVSGGYGNDNEIIHPTLYQTLISAIDSICGFDREQFKMITRDIKLKYLIDEKL